ncbi:MAG: ankyrin repeat domain-containing protein [Holosporaceae bacterium]|jgi:ankyrin repeat protein|nr:ankyrin repeat domain-containing protein [Holosporaceae bacterium]
MKKMLLIAICSIICEGMSAMAPPQVDLNDPALLTFLRKNIKPEAIFRAACKAARGNVPVLQLLRTLEPNIVNRKDEHGQNLLHHAVGAGRVDVVEELLTSRNHQVADASAPAPGAQGYTPLHMAVQLQSDKAVQIINLLINNGGADPSIGADGLGGDTPLDYAQSLECRDDVIALLQQAAARRAAAN